MRYPASIHNAVFLGSTVAVEVFPAESSRDVNTFVDVPWRVLDKRAHPVWVPPLRIAVKDVISRKNPFYKHSDRQLFLAKKNGKVVGRVAAIENRAHNEFHDDRVGFFGFFDAIDDQEVATALFKNAEQWLKSKKLDVMRGPMNPSTNHECGLLVGGFDQHPMIMTTWNPSYYQSLIESAGFTKAKDLLAFHIPINTDVSERYARLARRVEEAPNVTFRDLDLKHFGREVELCWEIYNAAWEKNWGFVPMNKDEFLHEAQLLKYIVFPHYSFMALVNGEPAGMMVVLPDYHHAFKAIGNGKLFPTGLFTILSYKKHLQASGRCILLGIKPKYRTNGLFALFINEVLRRGRERNASHAEASWILEDNHAMVRPMERLGAREYRRWRIYDRAI